MDATAVVFESPGELRVRAVTLKPPAAPHAVVDVEWSGISTGTERLLWTGTMPPFPGLGYPLVPGYESVGRVVRLEGGAAGAPLAGLDGTPLAVGDRVFVPGADCYEGVRGLFGGSASRVMVSVQRLIRMPAALQGAASREGVLLALAATAQHALVAAPADGGGVLVVGHGVLGRLLARLSVAAGQSPVVWERNPARASGAQGYQVTTPDEDQRRNYGHIYDVSGDAGMVEPLLARLSRGGELVLAGFYSAPISFGFPLAFMKEARLRVAAEWAPADLLSVVSLVGSGQLKLDGLVTHQSPVPDADAAYRAAFGDPACLKMVLDWSAST
jgi:3-hydroxyethyl bacteriochlorophyllide a dehydrogenase